MGTVSLRCVDEGVEEVTRLIGMREGVPSSVLSNDRFEPCRLGGLLPCLLGGLLLFRLPGKLPPGVSEDLSGADDFLVVGARENDPSLSLRESDVAENDDRPMDALPIGTLRALRSRTLVIGPALDSDADLWLLDEECLGLKADMLCDTPSARMNCSRSSMLVRPLALQGSFLIRNSSRATHPPPTRTMTVDRRMRTNRSF